MRPRLSLEQRLLRRLDTSGEHWLWTGAVSVGRDGEPSYGKIWTDPDLDGRRRCIGAHVAAHLVWIGPVPDGQEVSHLCDIPLCCNPACLIAETHAENARRVDWAGVFAERDQTNRQRDSLGRYS